MVSEGPFKIGRTLGPNHSLAERRSAPPRPPQRWAVTDPPRRRLGVVVSGLVVALQRIFCKVQWISPGPGAIQRLSASGGTRPARPAAGPSWVDSGGSFDGNRTGSQAGCHRPRCARRAARAPGRGNCDRVWIVVALAEPDLDPLATQRSCSAPRRPTRRSAGVLESVCWPGGLCWPGQSGPQLGLPGLEW